MRSIPQIAVDFVAKWEAFRGVAYRDSAGIPTLGFGHINGVEMGQRVTRAKALTWLAEDMEDARRKLYAVVNADVIECMTENQWSAILSLVFNVGIKKGSTLVKRLNAKAWDQIPLSMMQYVKAEDPETKKLVKIQGLVNRRAEEVKLWSTDEPGSSDVKLTSAVTRAVETPPVPLSPTPTGNSPTVWTTAGTAVGGTATAVGVVYDAVKPLKDDSPIVGNIVAIIAVVVAVLAAVAALLVLAQKKRNRS